MMSSILFVDLGGSLRLPSPVPSAVEVVDTTEGARLWLSDHQPQEVVVWMEG